MGTYLTDPPGRPRPLFLSQNFWPENSAQVSFGPEPKALCRSLGRNANLVSAEGANAGQKNDGGDLGGLGTPLCRAPLSPNNTDQGSSELLSFVHLLSHSASDEWTWSEISIYKTFPVCPVWHLSYLCASLPGTCCFWVLR